MEFSNTPFMYILQKSLFLLGRKKKLEIKNSLALKNLILDPLSNLLVSKFWSNR